MIDKEQAAIDVAVFVWMVIYWAITTFVGALLIWLFTNQALQQSFNYLTITKITGISALVFYLYKYYEYLKKGFNNTPE